MIAELRTYTINRGLMDSYLELYNKQIVPNHKKYGIVVLGAWVNRKQNEVVWMRLFESHEERKKKLDIYEASPERDAVYPIAVYHMAKHEVKVLDDAFFPSAQADASVLTNAVAQKALAAFAAIPKDEAAAFKAYTMAPR
jgi:uncharacterized protein YdcH (DUF465 family)